MTSLDALRIFLTSTFGFTNLLCFSDWRFSKKTSLMITAGLILLSTILISLLSYYAKTFLASKWFFMFILQFGIVIGAGYLLSKHKDFRTVFTVIIAPLYNQVGAILTLSLARVFHNKYIVIMIYFVVYAVLIFIAFFIARKSIISLMEIKKDGWAQLCALALFTYIIMLTLVPLPSSGSDSLFNIVAGLMLSLSIIWVFIFLRNELTQAKTRGLIEKSKYSIQFQVDKLKEQVIQMEENEKGLSMLRHDLKHNFLILSQLSASKDFEGCTKLLASLNDSVSKIETSIINTRFCNNRFINAVISSYAELYQKEHIILNVEINLNESSQNNFLTKDLESELYLDLAVVIGNCLDNALLATQLVQSVKKTPQSVSLRCFPAGEQTFLEIINPYLGIIKFDKKTGLPLSDKSGHGIGTVSTKSFADKYNSPISWKAENNIFVVRLIF